MGGAAQVTGRPLLYSVVLTAGEACCGRPRPVYPKSQDVRNSAAACHDPHRRRAYSRPFLGGPLAGCRAQGRHGFEFGVTGMVANRIDATILVGGTWSSFVRIASDLRKTVSTAE